MQEMFSPDEMRQIKLFGRLVFTSPFSAERMELEDSLLGRRHNRSYRVWHSVNGELSVNRLLKVINGLCDSLVGKGLERWPRHISRASAELLADWDLLALYWLFARFSKSMGGNIYLEGEAEAENARLYDDFAGCFKRVIMLPGRIVPSGYRPETIFALFHQIHRAFNYIFDFIAGGTLAAANLRTAIWQSIFTCDLRRYYSQLYSKMNTITTLVMGESGTGKELVARAIAFSQFIPFYPKSRKFAQVHRNCFHPVQLSAMPQALVESELFGHAKGAFTGAVEERHGFFETCEPCGSIFLDEIGDVSPETQVKLLRLLQTKQFYRLGDSKPLMFDGKVIAASNANLMEACREGRFRQDLLFRICSDTIHTAPLRTLVDGQEDELRQFVIVLAKRILDGADAEAFANHCTAWIVQNLGMDYPWPGNVRELEQCLRNLLIRGNYQPIAMLKPACESPNGDFFRNCGLTAHELMKQYLAAIYEREGTLQRTAKVAGLDRRTVKRYIDCR